MEPDGTVRWGTPVGVLGTVGVCHLWAPRYSLRHLEVLVRRFSPDLLCADIPRADWEEHRVSAFPLEYRECLVPLCRDLGIIVVPVGGRRRATPSPLGLAAALGAGARCVNSAADRWQAVWQCLGARSRRADSELVARVLRVVRRDPGRRILVTVPVGARHAVVEGLRKADEVVLVPVWLGLERW